MLNSKNLIIFPEPTIDLLNLRKSIKSVYKTGDFTLTSGRRSNFYVDVKSLLLNAMFLNTLARVIYTTIEYMYQPTPTCFIGGMELGSVPISTAVAMYGANFRACDECSLNQFIIRKQPRLHGTGFQVEGWDNIKDKRVVLVDDVLTTGGSLRKMYKVVKDHCDVLGCIVVFDRQELDITKDLKDLPDVVALIQKEDLV